jgi:hypothetical protein
MGHRALGLVHAQLHHLVAAGRREGGQGTVEYVALIFLVGAVFTAIVAAGKGKDFGLTKQITDTLKDTIGDVGK